MIERIWLWRRASVFTSLIVCDVILLYLTVFGEDTRLNQDLANGAMLTIVAIVNGYMGFSILDDKNKGKEKIAQSAVDQATPSTSETTVEINQ